MVYRKITQYFGFSSASLIDCVELFSQEKRRNILHKMICSTSSFPFGKDFKKYEVKTRRVLYF